MKTAVLDTDILSDLLKQKHARVLEQALEYNDEYGAITFSAITRYEVIRGYKQINGTRQLAAFAEFRGRSVILPVTDSILDRTAELWVAAGKGGFPRSDADLIIAATALEHSRVLVTGNTAHFAWIPGLVIEDWRRESL